MDHYKMTVTNKYYSLSILNSKNEHVPFSNGSFKLSHGTEYKVMLTNNHSSCQANAKVYIDGKRMGHFRLKTNGNIMIERPDDDQKARKLTFFGVNSEEGRSGGLVRSSELGKIKVEIQKERDPQVFFDSWSDDSDWSADCAAGGAVPKRGRLYAQCMTDSCVDGDVGGTALGRASKQKFYTASHIEVEPEVYILEARMVLIDEPAVIPL